MPSTRGPYMLTYISHWVSNPGKLWQASCAYSRISFCVSCKNACCYQQRADSECLESLCVASVIKYMYSKCASGRWRVSKGKACMHQAEQDKEALAAAKLTGLRSIAATWVTTNSHGSHSSSLIDVNCRPAVLDFSMAFDSSIMLATCRCSCC